MPFSVIIITFNKFDIHSRSQLFKKNPKDFQLIWLAFSMLPQLLGLLKLMLDLFHAIRNQGRVLYLVQCLPVSLLITSNFSLLITSNLVYALTERGSRPTLAFAPKGGT